MSTVTIARKNGIAAIAADTLTVGGNLRDTARYVKNHSKILVFKDSYVAVTGPSVAQMMLQDYFRKHQNKVRLDSVEAIFQTWLGVHKAFKEDYFVSEAKDDDSGIEGTADMDALILNPNGIFGVDYERTVQEFTRFYAAGSGREFALGAMFATYDDPERSAEDVARIGVEAAAEFHEATALPLQIYSLRLREAV